MIDFIVLITTNPSDAEFIKRLQVAGRKGGERTLPKVVTNLQIRDSGAIVPRFGIDSGSWRGTLGARDYRRAGLKWPGSGGTTVRRPLGHPTARNGTARLAAILAVP